MITINARTGASAPVDGRITWRFEIALLLAMPAERLGMPGGSSGMRQIDRVLASLPVGAERAMRPFELNQILPDMDRRTISSYLCALFRRGLCRRFGPLLQSRYYRDS